jgi:signal transduction histidine kinase
MVSEVSEMRFGVRASARNASNRATVLRAKARTPNQETARSNLFSLPRAVFSYSDLHMVALESTLLFGGLNSADTDLLKSSAEARDFAHGQVIFKEGDAGDSMYVVRSGSVQISALVGDGDAKPLARLKQGEYFGEMAVVDNQPRSASAIAEGATSVYYLPRELVLQLLERSPLLAVRMVREFSHRMREFNKRYVEELLQAERLTLIGRFARTIVHDFKNPLNVIGFAADLAGLEHSTSQTRTTAFARIHAQVDRLNTMINELLDFTRGSQNPIVLAKCNYGVFLQRILEELRPETGEKHVQIVCEEIPDVELLFDPRRLQQAFINLVHNATDAMPDGGKVLIRFHKRDNEFVTEIEDTGKGIPPEIAPRLFQPFATYGKSNGTGLGLSICKKIIVDHKGHIEAQTHPGRGAVFSFGLPLPNA